MRRIITLVLASSLILFPLFTYTYVKGCQDGIARYKHSKNFMMTLDRMYRYGYNDGISACGGRK